MAADCSYARKLGMKACFRCGETGHFVRDCDRACQIKTDVEVAADKSSGDAHSYHNNEHGDDEGWSPSQEAIDGGHVSGYTRAGYHVEDEVDWDNDALEGGGVDVRAPEKVFAKSTQRNSNLHPDRQKLVQEPYLGLPHFRNAKVEVVPPTVQDLRGYDYRIQVMYESKPMNQRFVNGGNGKIAPARYGSEQRHDLGLCFATFLTRKRCEMGINCPWRHHPLSNAERAWIIEYGKKMGKEFIDNVDRWWAFPEVCQIPLHMLWTFLTVNRSQFQVRI
jgi:hypothetical protein